MIRLFGKLPTTESTPPFLTSLIFTSCLASACATSKSDGSTILSHGVISRWFRICQDELDQAEDAKMLKVFTSRFLIRADMVGVLLCTCVLIRNNLTGNQKTARIRYRRISALCVSTSIFELRVRRPGRSHISGQKLINRQVLHLQDFTPIRLRDLH